MVDSSRQSNSRFSLPWVPDTKPIRQWTRASRHRKFSDSRGYRLVRIQPSTNANARAAPFLMVRPGFFAGAQLPESLLRLLWDRSLVIPSESTDAGLLHTARSPCVIASLSHPLHQNAANNWSILDRR